MYLPVSFASVRRYFSIESNLLLTVLQKFSPKKLLPLPHHQHQLVISFHGRLETWCYFLVYKERRQTRVQLWSVIGNGKTQSNAVSKPSSLVRLALAHSICLWISLFSMALALIQLDLSFACLIRAAKRDFSSERYDNWHHSKNWTGSNPCCVCAKGYIKEVVGATQKPIMLKRMICSS